MYYSNCSPPYIKIGFKYTRCLHQLEDTRMLILQVQAHTALQKLIFIISDLHVSALRNAQNVFEDLPQFISQPSLF